MKFVVRHSAARSRRRPHVVASARLNRLDSSRTFIRARESAPPYGVDVPAGALVRCASNPSCQNHLPAVFQRPRVGTCVLLRTYTYFRRTNTCIGSGLSSTSRYLAAV